jgi:hypothetical protein
MRRGCGRTFSDALAPPAVETPLLRGEFAEEMKDQKGMGVTILASRPISGIKLKQMAKMVKSREVTRPRSTGVLREEPRG